MMNAAERVRADLTTGILRGHKKIKGLSSPINLTEIFLGELTLYLSCSCSFLVNSLSAVISIKHMPSSAKSKTINRGVGLVSL